MSNLEIWEKVARPPKESLKTIQAGRLKGMTDISPQWRYKIMTEVFGPIGKGWSYSIEKLWTEQGANEEIMAFAHVSLHIHGQSIPGIGGSKLIAKEREGMHNSDEAYKMAVTDALSVAMKMLGVGADIYMGMWDGSKYKDVEQKSGKTNPAKNVLGKKPYFLGDGITISKEREGELEGVIAKTLKWCSEERWADALLEMDNSAQDNEEKIFMWSFLASNERSAITKEVAAQKAKYMNNNAATQP